MINVPAEFRVDVKKLKIKKRYFEDVLAGNKRAELRLNDRNYKKGDVYLLQEIDGTGIYTGRELLIRITHVLQGGGTCLDGLKEGWCVFSFEMIPLEEETKENCALPIAANGQIVELRASCFWLEKIDELLGQYRSKSAWESFVRTRAELEKVIEKGNFPSAITLSHVFNILEYCQRIIRDTAYDRAYDDRWKYDKGKKGQEQELSLKIVYSPPLPTETPAQEEREEEE